MERYGKRWSRLIFFLLRVQLHADQTLAARLVPPSSRMEYLLQEVDESSRSLHAVNTLGFSLDECLQHHNCDPENKCDPEEECESPLRLHATALQQAVKYLSVALTLQLEERDPFCLCVVAYCATCALDSHGAWVFAANYRPFLSAMIHCMQLWLLGHCITHCQSQDPPLRLQSYVREQCQLHLVNTSAGPIAELSCWRLLCQNSKNDAPRPPVTTITDDCMQINHADLEVRLSPWRQSLQQFLSDAFEILNEELLLGLAGLTAFSVTSLKDNLAELRPGLSFLDDPRNGLHAVRSNVVHQVCHDGPLRGRFFLRPGSTTDAESANGVLCNRPELDDYLHANQRFLQLLAILIIMTAGLPPRRKELLGISWCNQEVPRNIFIHNGLLAVITAYHKS